MYFLYILLALLVVLTALFVMPVSAEIYYEYIDKVQKMELTLRLYKIIKIKLPVNLEKKKKKERKAEKKKDKPKKSFSLERIKQLFSDIAEAFSDSKSDIYSLFYSVKKYLVIDKVLFETEYGLSDAAKTGMSYGAVWGAVSGALSAVDNLSEIKDVTLNIYPVFNRECFNLRTSCIIGMRLTHIIFIGIKLLKIVNCFTKILIKDE